MHRRRVLCSMTVLIGCALPCTAEQRIRVEPAGVQSAVMERLDKPRGAELRLADGSMLAGTVTAAPTRGLELDGRVVSYDQVREIRLDLGASKGWRIGGTILGLMAGSAIAQRTLGGDGPSGGRAAAGVAILIGAPVAGYMLGAQKRNWLVIEVAAR